MVYAGIMALATEDRPHRDTHHKGGTPMRSKSSTFGRHPLQTWLGTTNTGTYGGHRISGTPIIGADCSSNDMVPSGRICKGKIRCWKLMWPSNHCTGTCLQHGGPTTTCRCYLLSPDRPKSTLELMVCWNAEKKRWFPAFTVEEKILTLTPDCSRAKYRGVNMCAACFVVPLEIHIPHTNVFA